MNFLNLLAHIDINNLSLMHINCRSLVKNFNHICALLISSTISILAVTKTWLSDMANYIADDVVIPGYKFINRCRQGRRGGGVGFYVNNSTEFVECINPVSTNCDIIECLFIEIICKFNNNIIVGVIYCPPDTDAANFTTELDKLITTLTLAKKKIFFLWVTLILIFSKLIFANPLNTF